MSERAMNLQADRDGQARPFPTINPIREPAALAVGRVYVGERASVAEVYAFWRMRARDNETRATEIGGKDLRTGHLYQDLATVAHASAEAIRIYAGQIGEPL